MQNIDNLFDLRCLFEEFQHELSLIPIKQSTRRTIRLQQDSIAFINLIQHHNIQLLNQQACDYFSQLPAQHRHQTLQHWLQPFPKVLIFCQCPVVPDIMQLAQSETTIWRSNHKAQHVLKILALHIQQRTRKKNRQHGLFIEIFGVGVLLTGKPAIGKSGIGLELISQGHRLIADDIVELTKMDQDMIEGRSPHLLQDFMEVRGMGILNIRKLFGDNSIKSRKNLQLIIQLKHIDQEELLSIDRLNVQQTKTIFQQKIPQITLPVNTGRNTSTLVEIAIRQYIQRQQGYDASEDFIQRQQQSIDNH